MNAVALLAEAHAAGVTLRLADGTPKVGGDPPPDLLARLRAHKAELVELLRGDRCRHCSERMAWPGPAGLIFDDGTAAHHHSGQFSSPSGRSMEPGTVVWRSG